MRPAAYRYRLHADLPVTFHCGDSVWRLEKHGGSSAKLLRCDAVGADRFTVATASDDHGLHTQLRHTGIEVSLSSYLCTLFLRLEQLGLAERMHGVKANAA